MARIDNLDNFLTDVANAIKEKKGSETPILVSDFDTEISNLSTGGSTGTYAPRSISFYNCLETDMTNEVQGWDSSNLNKLDGFFYGCTNVKSLNLSHIDTSKVTSMMDCFRGCSSLTSLNIQTWNTDNVTAVNRMFRDCKSLKSIDLSNATFAKITNGQYMFENCLSLTKIDIRAWDITHVTTISGMFSDVPTNCLIIVKDDACKTWFASKYSSHTNVKTLAEYQG